MNVTQADFGNRLRSNIWACLVWDDCMQMDSGWIKSIRDDVVEMEAENYNGTTTTKHIPISKIDERIDS